jgi:integrase
LSSQPVLKRHHGSVKPYTRHVAACPHRRSKDHNSCLCPKWLYTRGKGEKSKRISLNTTSWEEAQEIATEKLRLMDPEVAAARAVNEKQKRKLVTITDGCDLFLKRVERNKGKSSGAYYQYGVMVRHLKRWAQRLQIEHIQEITTPMLERWYSEKPWSGFSPTTRRQVWINVRGMFRYWFEHDLMDRNPAAAIKPVDRPEYHVQGPYSGKQIEAILKHIEAEREPRLRAFILLLLHVGCDVIDAVVFNPTRIEDVTIDGKTVHVYKYKRLKTKVKAIVTLPNEVVRELRSVPRLAENSESMPFRNPGTKLLSDRSEWSKRVIRTIKAAGVIWVELPPDDEGRQRRKQANCKQFRHTAAVRWLSEGQMPEDVAKMLGHVNAEMIRRFYAPWVPDLEEAYLRRVARMQHS